MKARLKASWDFEILARFFVVKIEKTLVKIPTNI